MGVKRYAQESKVSRLPLPILGRNGDKVCVLHGAATVRNHRRRVNEELRYRQKHLRLDLDRPQKEEGGQKEMLDILPLIFDAPISSPSIHSGDGTLRTDKCLLDAET
ncbi:uridine permease [Moniliophthora roreri]|nr:uridine permease [Moniliophthora roreri]